MQETDFAFYVGVDWGATSHQVCILDASGAVRAEKAVSHSGAAVQALCQRLLQLAPAGQVAVAIESPSSPVTDSLLECGLTVFSVNPKQLDRFRDRFYPSGAKDDRRDSFVLATSLRTDRRCFRRLSPQDPPLLELRALMRLDQTLKADLRAYCNRLREALLLTFPQILELSPAVDEPWIWALLEKAPSPPAAARLSLAKLRSLLERHRIRRITPDELRAKLRQPALPVPQASFDRCAVLLGRLLPLVAQIALQQRENASSIAAALEQLSRPAIGEQKGQPRDAAILLSLPGVGPVVAATLLAEAAEPLRLRDYHALRALAGVAPVTRQSGKSCVAIMRRACNHALREALYHWSRVSAMRDPRAQAVYARLRAKGHSHGRALRGLADRQLRLLCAMLRAQQVYDPLRVRLAA